MGDFSADWLALREPADHRARSTDLAERLARWHAEQGAPGPQRLLDLGAGTGSNLRFLTPRLGGDQDWICVDQDPELLAALVGRTADWARTRGLEATPEDEGLRIAGAGLHCRVATRRLDLAAGATALPLGSGTLVVASALMDLVSEAWLADLLQACHRTRSPVLAALSYDGRVELAPREPLDGLVIALVNGHQGRDKGLGAALGPGATRALARLGGTLGYEALDAPSDWDLGPDEAALQGALIGGWADAAREQVSDAPGLDPDGLMQRLGSIDRWRDARLGHVAVGRSHLQVGHQDLLLLPPMSVQPPS
jgi:SAM-dependent methyltransferase